MTHQPTTPARTRHKRAQVLKTDAIHRRLEHHARSCTYWIFSGDRHCSCGRDQALQELEAIERTLATEYERN